MNRGYLAIAAMVAAIAIVAGIALALYDGGGQETVAIEVRADPDGMISAEDGTYVIGALGAQDEGVKYLLRAISESAGTLTIPAEIMAALRDAGGSLEMGVGDVNLTLSEGTVRTMDEGTVRFAVESSEYPGANGDAAGRPWYTLELTAGGEAIAAVPGGCEVSVRYALKAGERGGDLYALAVGNGGARLPGVYKDGRFAFAMEELAHFVLCCSGSQGDVQGGYREPASTPPSQWSYFGGDMGSFGVTDSKTPTDAGGFALKWKVSYPTESGSMVWRTPSSALCVDDWVYYWNGMDDAVYRLDIETGKVLARGDCPSRPVFNMGLAYGDGKLFATTSTGTTTVLRAYDAVTLEQLFVGAPVDGGEVQGTVTYLDGMVFFGTYSGDYACFSTEDRDIARHDESADPVWVMRSEGWYNATPAFFDDSMVLVQKGFSTGGATAYLLERGTGLVRDSIHFDREYSSSGATFYEGRVYIPLSRVIDRSVQDPDERDAQRLVIRSYGVSPEGFDRGSARYWESDSKWGSTQSMAVIWNDTIYIGGGGKTMGTDEPLWVLDISADGSIRTRAKLGILTKSTPMLTTAYSSADNGFAVYLYLMEYGHVYEGEEPDSSNGYADVFVVRDSKGAKPRIAAQFRPDPEQFCYQSFTISKSGYVLIRNDSTLFCYGNANLYTAEDVSAAIERFLAMARAGNVNMRDYERIVDRYLGLPDSERSKVSNFQALQEACCTVTLRAYAGDITVTVPRGAWADLPRAAAPDGKHLRGWEAEGAGTASFGLVATDDTVLLPVYADSARITLDPANGGAATVRTIAEGDRLPYIPDPVREGFEFDGWYLGDALCVPYETAVHGDSRLVARWSRVSELFFDPNGGAPVDGRYLAVEGRPLGPLPAATRTGHTFLGWYHGDEAFAEGRVYPYDHAITLRARWSENPEGSVSNGKGITVTGPIGEGSTLEAAFVSKVGSTYAELVDACRRDHAVSADCLVLTVKGEGVDANLPLRVSAAVGDAHNGRTLDVYYSHGGVKKTSGTVENGVLTFEAYGKKVYGGVQLSFGIPVGTEIGGCVRCAGAPWWQCWPSWWRRSPWRPWRWPWITEGSTGRRRTR